ncbi:MAG: 4Fe-4S dicluster domain-containing protein [Bacteroidota bacterium]
MTLGEYFGNIYKGLKSLWTGLSLTGKYFVRRGDSLTEEYPNNRQTLKLAERFRGEVVMPHNESNEHRCTGCTACELACPNGSIKILTKFVVNEEGKKKKAIDTFVYHLDTCTMCNLCIVSCPSDAIIMANNFEHSVFDRTKLLKVLNKPDSKIMAGVE